MKCMNVTHTKANQHFAVLQGVLYKIWTGLLQCFW